MRKSALLLAAALAALSVAAPANADTKDKKIALSNNYAGNSWRQSMLKSWDKVTKCLERFGTWASESNRGQV